MKLSDLHDVIPVSSKDLPDVAITGVTADTRAISKGNIFIAVPGVKVNGAAFAAEAVEKGAVAVICGIDAEIDVLPVPVIRVEDPRRDLALLAAAIHTPQPETIVAVTGTAGKTSVAAFTRQIFEHAELKAASIGTTGVEAPGITIEGALTTPDPVKLHQILKQLSDGGVTHAAMEASSHGLDQRRLDGVRLAAAAFTNLGRDHMDYHPTIGDYLNAKMRLFDTLMDRGKPAVIFADDPYSGAAIDAAKTAGLDVRTVGRRGDYINLTRVEHEQHRQIAEIVHAGQTYRVELPLAGDFQIANALVSAGLAISCGVEPKIAFAALEHLKGAPGRLELVGKTANGAPVYVDYAHKPEALQQVLESVRPFTPGEVVVVFGCGGDRDPGKRPIMGGIAAQYSDCVYVTDDNPRSEDPALIRKAIMEAAPDAIEIGDRREAIFTAVKSLKKGDTLVIAGKGHETGQTAKGQTRHFSDHEEAREAIEVAAHVPEPVREPLWTGQAMIDAMGARPINGLPTEITGISIDSRTIKPGEAFFAIKGDQFDGHDFATKAAGKGASCLVVSEARIPALGRLTVPLMVVDDVMDAMCKLAGAARARTKAQIVAITGSAGKTTTKDALRHSLQGQGRVHAAAASFNNHWGVPLTLARMPADTEFGIFEIGMNHPGEITPLVKMVKPHLAIITLIAGAHLGHFKDLDEIAHAKAEIFSGVVDGGAVLLNRDDKRYKLLNDLAVKAGITNRYSFGENKQSDVKLTNGKFLDDCSCLSVKVFEDDLAVKISVPGRHIAQNVLAVLGAIKLTGGDIAVAGHALAKLTASDGRGRRYRLKGTGGEFILIDESYNANPASMEAALAMLAEAKPGPRGRRIAVLGDMLEMGEHSGKLHAALADPIARSDLSTIYLAGSEMGALDAKLPEALESHYFEEPSQLQNAFTDVPRGGDVIMIKSSNGLGFRRVVKTLLDTYGPPIED